MRPALVTDVEVLEAARRVRARGEEINGWSIRREVGDRGNPRRLLAVWTAQGDTAPPAQAEPAHTVSLPAPVLELVAAARSSLASDLDTIVCTIHRHAREDADATYRRITDDLQASQLRISGELDLAEASVGATEAELNRRGEAIATLEAEVGEARVQIAGLTERERQALDRAQQAEAQAADLQGELEGFGRAAQAAAEARAAAEAQTAAMRDEVAHLRTALERSETARNTEVSRLSADLTRAQQQIDKARAAHQADAATARQQATNAQAAHREEVNRIQQELAKHQGEVTRLLADLEAAKRQQAEAETVTREALSRAGEAAGRATALEEQLRALQPATAVAAHS
ncbi:hypothetical protein E2C06_11845 [Dankookia rubra]|uniref:Uncharacterized protein n=1 Tax=Dankookia rubra TaxID=1442381 RepID=A0A4R5QH80_9PROT|nr:DNA-binding protein [Dankookia rubra]TDH62303.1 hypothetical protein E2C06_11845 [Dankookia rubra]